MNEATVQPSIHLPVTSEVKKALYGAFQRAGGQEYLVRIAQEQTEIHWNQPISSRLATHGLHNREVSEGSQTFWAVAITSVAAPMAKTAC